MATPTSRSHEALTAAPDLKLQQSGPATVQQRQEQGRTCSSGRASMTGTAASSLARL